ncbi:YkvA family protein [Anaerosinus massiliensis]|uniref:YkvA family protein n=1 Tax=Massilibacillus massiliensis TaxID=1806837 RepID=UPI0018FECD87|nr:YkvA family protein [Massilibacillus massiliensis]
MWLKLWTWMRLFRENFVLLYFAWKNPATPRYLKTLLLIVIGYLLSPIDLVPDSLPVIGLLDDMTIVPAALYLLMRGLPEDVRIECQRDMKKLEKRMPYILTAIAVIGILWVAFLIWGVYSLWK